MKTTSRVLAVAAMLVSSIALGDYNHVPIIEGTNRNEGRLFVAIGFDLNPAVGALTTAEYPTAVEGVAAALVTEESGLLATRTGRSSIWSPAM